MPRLTFLASDGAVAATVDAAARTSVMAVAIANGIDGIVGECGGNGMCATCHVYVEEPWVDALPAMSEDEDALLEGTASERRPESRLGCQLRMGADLDGLAVRLPPRQT